MNIEQVAIQLYTLRERMKTRDEIESTLKRVKEIGYPAIQVSGLSWDLIPEEAMVELCADLDLQICATHETPDDILHHPEKVIQRMTTLGCKYTAYPFPRGIDFTQPDSVSELTQKLDRSGAALANAGLVLTYHNHHIEFQKLDGKLILESIYAETDPVNLQAEIDTYWVQFGGGDPVSWCKKLQNRLPLLHLKDYRINGQNEVEFCEIGSGNLDFPAILDAADSSGCKWYIVEQDVCPGDEFDSIAQSFEYIKTRLIH